ncbi:MAG: hypothetical protein CMG62_01275 [Candidatus Marinimicrobia bacterium]|nr:hypothetical protein [Candidatus Neomarinimicrobiota bacterium]
MVFLDFNMKKIKIYLPFLYFSFICFTSCASFVARDISRPIKSAKMDNIQVNDLNMYYYSIGNSKNPPLIFLHGSLAFSELYKKIITSLSENYFVIAVDMRGHGRTDIGIESFSYYTMANDIVSFAELNGIAKFYSVGHSMGGVVVLSISKYFPEKIIKGVSIASLYHYDGLDFDKNQRYSFYTSEGFKDINNNITLKLFNESYEFINQKDKFINMKAMMVQLGTSVYPSYTKNDLNSINVPILVIVADNDGLIFPSHTKEMAKNLPGSDILIVPDATHSNVIRKNKNVNLVSNKIISFFN